MDFSEPRKRIRPLGLNIRGDYLLYSFLNSTFIYKKKSAIEYLLAKEQMCFDDSFMKNITHRNN